MTRERSLVDWLRSRQPGSGLGLPGDDAAVVESGGRRLAVTVDQQIAGVHVPEDLDPGVWARRLLAVNLSDIAAMGARPAAALLTLAVPPAFPIRRFLDAAVQACRRHDLVLAGGDMATAPVAVTTMTLLGRRPPRGRWLPRTAARPGDTVWVGGPLGGSAAGQRLVALGARWNGRRVDLPPALEERFGHRAARRAVRRHLDPKPQLELGEWLSRRRRAAAIDVSDGLGIDLSRLAAASGVGAEIDAQRLPIARSAIALAPRLGVAATELAFAGGEDYVLLFALPPSIRVPAELGAVAIGRTTAGGELVLVDRGARRPLPATGWDHFDAVSDP